VVVILPLRITDQGEIEVKQQRHCGDLCSLEPWQQRSEESPVASQVDHYCDIVSGCIRDRPECRMAFGRDILPVILTHQRPQLAIAGK
jgi:hypothetical protein